MAEVCGAAQTARVCASSVRRRLLFRGRRHGDVPDRKIELAPIEAGARGGPVLRRQLEIAIARPVRHDADHVGEVPLDVEAVQLARRDQREEVRRPPVSQELSGPLISLRGRRA